MRTFTDLREIDDFYERYRYLRVTRLVGQETFGSERMLNQVFYRSREWKDIRHHVISRDNGCDLGDDDFPIRHQIHVHHMNPITPQDIHDRNPDILNPEFLISVSQQTHNAIHYSDERQLPRVFVARAPGDTKLW